MRKQTDGLSATRREVLLRWMAAHDRSLPGLLGRPVGHPKRQAVIRRPARVIERVETARNTRRY